MEVTKRARIERYKIGGASDETGRKVKQKHMEICLLPNNDARMSKMSDARSTAYQSGSKEENLSQEWQSVLKGKVRNNLASLVSGRGLEKQAKGSTGIIKNTVNTQRLLNNSSDNLNNAGANQEDTLQLDDGSFEEDGGGFEKYNDNKITIDFTQTSIQRERGAEGAEDGGQCTSDNLNQTTSNIQNGAITSIHNHKDFSIVLHPLKFRKSNPVISSRVRSRQHHWKELPATLTTTQHHQQQHHHAATITTSTHTKTPLTTQFPYNKYSRAVAAPGTRMGIRHGSQGTLVAPLVDEPLQTLQVLNRQQSSTVLSQVAVAVGGAAGSERGRSVDGAKKQQVMMMRTVGERRNELGFPKPNYSLTSERNIYSQHQNKRSIKHLLYQ